MTEEGKMVCGMGLDPKDKKKCQALKKELHGIWVCPECDRLDPAAPGKWLKP